MLKKLLTATMLAAMLPVTAAVAAPAYPTKPVKFVVPYPAGGPLDTVARAIGEKLRDSLGQPVVVENKPGAGGNLGADYVAKQPADGYTIVMGAVATHAINPTLFSKMPYDPVKDFAPVTLVADVPNVLVMHPGKAAELHIGNVRELVEYARKHPGKLDYASGGNGSAGHLSGELFKSMAKISMVHIPYNGASPAQLSVLSGQTDLIFDNLARPRPISRPASSRRSRSRPPAAPRRSRSCRRSRKPARGWDSKASTSPRGSACSRPPTRRAKSSTGSTTTSSPS